MSRTVDRCAMRNGALKTAQPTLGSAPPKSVKRKYATAPLGSFIWERQEGESPAAHARFTAYRNMPVEMRSMRKLGVSPSLAFRWAKRHQWSKRVAAYDAWVQELAEQLAMDKAVEMRAEHALFGRMAMRKAKEAIEAMPAKKLKPAEAVSMGCVGIEIEREARGLSSEDQRDNSGGTTVQVFNTMPSVYGPRTNGASRPLLDERD